MTDRQLLVDARCACGKRIGTVELHDGALWWFPTEMPTVELDVGEDGNVYGSNRAIGRWHFRDEMDSVEASAAVYGAGRSRAPARTPVPLDSSQEDDVVGLCPDHGGREVARMDVLTKARKARKQGRTQRVIARR